MVKQKHNIIYIYFEKNKKLININPKKKKEEKKTKK